MARKVVQVCDLHRGDASADDALVIVLEGTRYQLDLCADHLGQVRRTLAPLLDAAHAARPGGGSRQVDGSRRARAAERTALREWARAQGFDVRDRGRVPREAVEAYTAWRESGATSAKPAARARRRAS
ncbi:MAG TPA: histone-like nucleoid-structuring protein Lsr2 [Mycobacteriales bacterium]|nr:histone-like nucleoid-structuring protein Lsr2 [Mycobacteriales bacterium]